MRCQGWKAERSTLKPSSLVLVEVCRGKVALCQGVKLLSLTSLVAVVVVVVHVVVVVVVVFIVHVIVVLSSLAKTTKRRCY